MSNPYYNHGSVPATGSTGSSSSMRAEFDAITSGFALLPTLSGFGNKAVVVNAGGTGLTTSAGSLSLAGDLTLAGALVTSGAYNLTLTLTAATNVTLPTTGTLATLAGTETLTNKTITSPVLSGSVTGTYTLAGTLTITAPTISSPVLSGSVTGTYTLAGTATITSPTISGPILSGSVTGTYTLAGALTITSPVLNGSITGSAVIGVPNGGTGASTLTSGGVLIGAGASPITSVTGSAGQMLHVNAASGAPAFRSVALTQSFRGLSLRSHPDSDSVTSKIQLMHADEIVVSDGTRVSPADLLTFDKAVTGSAGGMQAAAVASTWNKLYYIRKSSDGTEGLWGLRAKDYFLDQSFVTSTDTNRSLRIATSTPTDKIAQGFQLATAGKLEFVEVLLSRAGSVVGNYWFTIEADVAGSPSGTPLATSDKYDASRVPTSSLYVRLPFRTPATLSAATQYHLVFQADYTRSDTVVLLWSGVIAGGYANGSSKDYNGASWAATPGANGLDRNFKLYVTRNDTAIAAPSGYDQYAQIGWFYIDSGGLIKRFTQQDRRVVTAMGASWKVGAFSTGFKTIIDGSAFFPPVPTSAIFGAGIANVGEEVGIGLLTALDMAASSDITDTVTIHSTPSGTDAAPNAATLSPIQVEYQGFNLNLSVSTTPGIWVKGFTW